MEYPFLDNHDYNNNWFNEIPDMFINNSLKYDQCIGVYNNSILLVYGVNKNEWNDYLHLVYIKANLMKILNIVFIWSKTLYYQFNTLSFNYDMYNTPQNFDNVLKGPYRIGYTISTNGNVRETLKQFCGDFTYQVFVGESPISKRIIPFNGDNKPAFDLIKQNGLTVYCHAYLNSNLCKYDESTYISEILNCCTAHGILGVVFHVGKNNDGRNINDDLNFMFNNIVNGIRGFISKVPGKTCKFLLETPAGKGNETLFDYSSFLNFCLAIKNTDVGQHFGVCVDTCHVFSCGYLPYDYIFNISKYINVELIHFNDSKTPFCSRKDSHQIAGKGSIPWFVLYKTAELCFKYKINMVNEW